MSVIQEALEKAGSELSPRGASVEDSKEERNKDLGIRPKPDAKKTPKMPATIMKMLATVVILACAAAAFFFIGRSLTKLSSRLYITPDMRTQDVRYRPIVRSIEKSPAATTKSSAAIVKIPDRPRLILNGIMYMEEGPRAIVNNLIVEPGDLVGGAKVTKIERQCVILEYENVEITLNLK